MQDRYSLTKEQNVFLAKKNLIKNIYAGALLENPNITFPVTQTILEGVNVPSVSIDDITTILNLRDAWKWQLNNLSQPFDLDYACKINSLVARNESLDWGVLRYGVVGIGGTDYKPPIPQKAEVITSINLIINSPKSVTEKAIDYFLYAARSQLFWDGNKRTAFICANKLLIENGCGIMTVTEKNLAEFNTKLCEFYETGNDNQIKDFLYNNCISGIDYCQEQSLTRNTFLDLSNGYDLEP